MVVGLELYLLYFSASKCVTYFEMSIQSSQKVPADSQFHLSVLFMMPSSCQGKERNSLKGKGCFWFYHLGERMLLVESLLAGGLFSMEMSSNSLRERQNR